MMRIKAAIVAAAAVAGLAVATAPAQASECKAEGGGRYICEYGVSEHQLPDGWREQFIIGTNYAVFTRAGVNGKWSKWQSLGGVARSQVYIESGYQGGDFYTRVFVERRDGSNWQRIRPSLTKVWGPWEKSGGVKP
ncbi:hypothetical protein [Streptomyces flavofungini]|uniref:hypothetical protein n=1 Tax=Streptomyces flavofungini TaxID=68200 RepID=UPI0034DFE960